MFHMHEKTYIIRNSSCTGGGASASFVLVACSYSVNFCFGMGKVIESGTQIHVMLSACCDS